MDKMKTLSPFLPDLCVKVVTSQPEMVPFHVPIRKIYL